MVIYSVIHKRVFTPLPDLPTRIIEAIDHSSNSTMAFTKTFMSRIFCKCKCHCWVWRMIDSLYYLSRKIRERYENSFLNCRINYQKFCYSLQRIWTQPLYSFSEMNFLYIQLLVSYWILGHNWKTENSTNACLFQKLWHQGYF